MFVRQSPTRVCKLQERRHYASEMNSHFRACSQIPEIGWSGIAGISLLDVAAELEAAGKKCQIYSTSRGSGFRRYVTSKFGEGSNMTAERRSPSQQRGEKT